MNQSNLMCNDACSLEKLKYIRKLENQKADCIEQILEKKTKRFEYVCSRVYLKNPSKKKHKQKKQNIINCDFQSLYPRLVS